MESSNDNSGCSWCWRYLHGQFLPPILPTPPRAHQHPTGPVTAIAGNVSPLEELREFDAWR